MDGGRRSTVQSHLIKHRRNARCPCKAHGHLAGRLYLCPRTLDLRHATFDIIRPGTLYLSPRSMDLRYATFDICQQCFRCVWRSFRKSPILRRCGSRCGPEGGGVPDLNDYCRETSDQLLKLVRVRCPGDSGRGTAGLPNKCKGGSNRGKPRAERNLNLSNMQRLKKKGWRPPAPSHRAACDARTGKTRDL